MSKAFFDTNIIAYFVSNDPVKAAVSARLLQQGGVISVQVLNEFASLTIRKLQWSVLRIRGVLAAVRSTCSVEPLTEAVTERALDVAEQHKLNTYDALIVASALLAGCSTLYTEDLHDGLVIDGLTVRNPYAQTP